MIRAKILPSAAVQMFLREIELNTYQGRLLIPLIKKRMV